MRSFAEIRKVNLDLIQKAISILLDNPHLSNREVASQLGVDEGSIRYWKKLPIWGQERQKLINDRAELMELNKAQQRIEYRENLETQQQQLKYLREQIHQTTTRSLGISTQVYVAACAMDDSINACEIATKAGAHTQAKVAIDGVKSIMLINEHLHQISILIEYFEGLGDD